MENVHGFWIDDILAMILSNYGLLDSFLDGDEFDFPYGDNHYIEYTNKKLLLQPGNIELNHSDDLPF